MRALCGFGTHTPPGAVPPFWRSRVVRGGRYHSPGPISMTTLQVNGHRAIWSEQTKWTLSLSRLSYDQVVAIGLVLQGFSGSHIGVRGGTHR